MVVPAPTTMKAIFLLLNSAALLLPRAESFSDHVIVVGKIIVDEYGDPSKSEAPAISIGGGGPQAAFGAAAALAVRDCYDDNGLCSARSSNQIPPRMPVTFLGAVGNDWSEDDSTALSSILAPAIETEPVLVPSDEHITPRIRLWHDESQNVQWYAVNDSFGPVGADGLWRNRPSASDILLSLNTSGVEDKDSIVLHTIAEAGDGAAGGGMDSDILRDSNLLQRLSFVGVEPIAFMDEERGKVSTEDAKSCIRLIDSLPQLDLLCPDSHLDSTLQEVGYNSGSFHIVARDGPNGSILYERSADAQVDTSRVLLPACTLETDDGEPVNPTGAGNAYSGALSALLGTGSSLLEAATIATGVGAAVCEYEQLPPWTWEVLDRIYSGSNEVKESLTSRSSL